MNEQNQDEKSCFTCTDYMQYGHPGVRYTDRLNVHFARMGEPIFNLDVLAFAGWLGESKSQIQEESCKEAGFDTLVFIPSQDEEDGLVTCGNAILGGSKLKVVSVK